MRCHRLVIAGVWVWALSGCGAIDESTGPPQPPAPPLVSALTPAAPAIGEIGVVRVNQPATATWHTLPFKQPYTHPVVVMHALSFNGGDPSHLRVDQVGVAAARWQIEEWAYRDGAHITEDCPYLVVEAGVHRLEDGTVIEAGTVQTDHQWKGITFSHEFGTVPVLLTGVMSEKGGDPVVVRVHNLSRTGALLRLQEEEGKDDRHLVETLGWIAISPGSGQHAGHSFVAGRTSKSITHAWASLPLGEAFAAPPVLLANIDSYFGGDTAGLRFRNLQRDGAEIRVEEEASANSETWHTQEQVSYLAWQAPGLIPASDPGVAYRTHGLNFSPYIAAGENPDTGLDNQITDTELRDRLAAIAPYTDWIRTFGCNNDLKEAGQYAHEMGKQAALGAWIGSSSTANRAQIDCLVAQAAAGHADMAVVGSESLLRGDVTPTALVNYINEVRTRLAAVGVDIPVTTADTYGLLLANPNVLGAVDVVFANYYPFWEGSSVDQAMARIHRWHQQLQAAAPGKPVLVSETGWPSCGEQFGEAVPSPENASLFFLQFVSWARANTVPYFYFEAYDEPWKLKEGARGACWGVFDTDAQMKSGMQRVFDGETVPDTWTDPNPGPPIIDFTSLPSPVQTNLSTFLVTGATAADNTVLLNGSNIPADTKDDNGMFAVPVALTPGSNALSLVVKDTTGKTVSTTVRTIVYDTSVTTAGRRLLYVDAVPADGPPSTVDGTVVVDLDGSAILGLIPGRHVRGIAPDGSAIYTHDRAVISTASHQQLRTLPLRDDIEQHTFAVSPTGDRLYSAHDVIDVATNTRLSISIPLNTATGGSWAGSEITASPTVSSDGKGLYCRNTVQVMDTATYQFTRTSMSGYIMGDIALSPDDSLLLVSEFSYAAGYLKIYDAKTWEQLGSVGGLGDFAGQIGVVGNDKAVVGTAGNAIAPTGGRLTVVDLNSGTTTAQVIVPLGNNVATSGNNREVFVSTGAFDEVAGTRPGVDVWLVSTDGKLNRSKTFFLGINRFVVNAGRPTNDQIRQIVYKPL